MPFFKESSKTPKYLEDPVLGPQVRLCIQKHLPYISDESLLKITRQLDFWYSEKTLNHDDFLHLVNELVHVATWFHRIFPNVDASTKLTVSQLKKCSTFQVPKVRFGRTSLLMPIITCGGMRFQQTWLPDFVPYISPKRSKVLKSPSQENIKDIVRNCLAVGLNHFETARFYGTSEYQLVDALYELIQSGEINRSDFIFQTKVGPTKTREDFEKAFMQSWENIGTKLGYIDLLAIHGLGMPSELAIMEGTNTFMDAAMMYKEEKKVHFVGFSTHGSADIIMKLICSNKFDFVNLHCHFFGSYHAEGTPDTIGGYGNEACIKKALELDMGLFNISPFDKGGKLYNPTKKVAKAIGPKLSPIAFAALYDWNTLGFHTVSVGLGRPSDLDEVLRAAELYAANDVREVNDATVRLTNLKKIRLGEEWIRTEYENIPTCWESSSGGVGISHLLWLHDLLCAYGMYDFCKERYHMCEVMTKKWDKSKTIEENSKDLMGYAFNPGTLTRPDVNLKEALKARGDVDAVVKKMDEVNLWLTGDISEQERKDRGFEAAYSLTTWGDYPGLFTLTGVLLQNLTGGLIGAGGGKDPKLYNIARDLRKHFFYTKCNSAV